MVARGVIGGTIFSAQSGGVYELRVRVHGSAARIVWSVFLRCSRKALMSHAGCGGLASLGDVAGCLCCLRVGKALFGGGSLSSASEAFTFAAEGFLSHRKALLLQRKAFCRVGKPYFRAGTASPPKESVPLWNSPLTFAPEALPRMVTGKNSRCFRGIFSSRPGISQAKSPGRTDTKALP
jgi:hypothetical protein